MGEDSETISSQLGVSRERLDRWKSVFVEAGTHALTHRSHERAWLGAIRKLWKRALFWGGLILALAMVIMVLIRAFAPQE